MMNLRDTIAHQYRLRTSSWRRLPDFLILGTQKGGTTSLYQYIIEHPAIISATRKEIRYFFNPKEYLDGQTSLGWYKSHFPFNWSPFQPQSFLTGEATPEYLYIPHTPERTAATIPQAKLIILLRDPIKRAYSQYRHNVRRNVEKLSFSDAIAREEERIGPYRERVETDPTYLKIDYNRFGYQNRGVYWRQLDRWQRCFPDEQFLILKSEDFFANPEDSVNQVFAFLGLSPLSLKEYPVNNSGNAAPLPIDAQTHQTLVDFFQPHNQKLVERLGPKFQY
ncbi:MAG: sulfotransferase domain-containing protein [Cyanobacteria bacterium P01_H01_bin.15]